MKNFSQHLGKELMTEMSTFAVDLKNIHEVFKCAQKKCPQT